MNGLAMPAPPPNAFLHDLSGRLGLGFAMQRYVAAESAIRDKMRRQSPDAFLAELERDSKLLQEVIETVVVTETHFFRHPQHFLFLRDSVLPALTSDDRKLRVWSAGCSTGEEAYSLAIMLHQCGLSSRAEILATDVSHSAMETAQKAVYRAWALRGIDEWPGASRYFQRLPSGDYRLSREVATLVSFRRMNMAGARHDPAWPLPGTIDILLCRNVLIYMTNEVIAKLAQRLFEALAPGGWLIPGPSDPVAGRGLPRPLVTPHGIFYQREPGSETATAASEPLRRAGRSSHRPSMLARPIWEKKGDVARPATASSPERRRSYLASGGRGTGGSPTSKASHSPTPDGKVKPQRLLDNLKREVGRMVNAGCADEAIALAQAEIDRQPLSSDGYYLLAFVHWHSGRLGAALANIGKALYLEPDCAVGHQLQGLLLAQEGQVAQARRAFRTAYQLASRMPGDVTIRLGEGTTAATLARAAQSQLRGLQVLREPA